MLKTILVEDEERSLKVLQHMLQPYQDIITVIGSYLSSLEALEAIRKLRPNLIFLDIQMPELNGFQLLDKIQDFSLDVIFTTAHEQFAIKGYDHNAIGYLLKPIDADDLKKAIDRIKPRPRQITQPKASTKVPLPTAEGVLFVPIEQIVRCQSLENHTTVYLSAKGKTLEVYHTLKYIEQLLGDVLFFRTHQSYLVNVDHITKLVRSDGGYLVMSDGGIIPIAAGRRESFEKKHLTFFSS